jgi:hypothetical protein
VDSLEDMLSERYKQNLTRKLRQSEGNPPNWRRLQSACTKSGFYGRDQNLLILYPAKC